MTGFLVGDVVHHVKDTISDSQINNVEVKTKTYVFDCIPCPKDQLYYNTSGEILKQKIKDLLPEKHQSIVGWYSFRRNSTIRPSFRERLLHYNLTRALGQDVNMFLFFLCSSRASTNKSTHTFDHSFLHLDNNIFKKVPVDIINLGDTTHAEYRCSPSQTVASKHGAFSKIVKIHEGDFLNTHGHMEVKGIQMLNGAIRRHLDSVSQSVIDSEARCSSLEQEVTQYRKRAKLKLLEKQQQQQKSLEVMKGPPLDDILSVDQSDVLPSDILQGQGLIDKTEGQQVKYVEKNPETDSDMEQDINSGIKSCHGKSGKMEDKSFSVKLTSPLVLHTRSSSTPVDIASVSSQSNMIRTRSRSGDTDVRNEQRLEMNVKNVGNVKSEKNSDPFDFVGSILADSKKSHKLSFSRKAKRNDLETEGSMETEASGSDKHRQTKQKNCQTVHNNINNDLKSGEDSQNVEKTNKSQEKPGNIKTFGQKTANKQHIVIETDESSSSQDNYEMDVSSSPVY